MFELKNYTFVNDYSTLVYRDVSSLHIFFVTGKLIPRLFIGKKGVVFLKNDIEFHQIIGFKFSLLSITKNVIRLDPNRLKHKGDNAVEVKFNNALTNRNHVLSINKITLDYIRSSFKSITYKASKSVKGSLSRNYSKRLYRIKLKSRLIQIKS